MERIGEFLGKGWRAEPLGEGRAQCAGHSRGWKESSCGRKIRLVLSFDLIERSMAIEMDEGHLAPV